MNENFCIDICRQSKLRCVIRMKNDALSYHGCIGRKDHEEFIRDFSRTTFISHVDLFQKCNSHLGCEKDCDNNGGVK